MQDTISTAYGLWGGLLLLLILQAVWGQFLSYPASFERMLRRGRSWVYVPRHWKGVRKAAILAATRLFAAGIGLLLAFLLALHARLEEPGWVMATALAGFASALWLQGFWNHLRYRQQEDAYFLLHDELRSRLERENKDVGRAQLRSLASYQHQQQLRKADEEGRFLSVLRSEAKRFRMARPDTPSLPEA